ncbi:hypothetical protein HN011_005427 [Eciton burchellii]|nr:hypothetical protein HN011_005427 [Eciton burchellii]
MMKLYLAVNPSIVIILAEEPITLEIISNSALRMMFLSRLSTERTTRAQAHPSRPALFPISKAAQSRGGGRGGGHVFRRRMKKQIGTVDDGWRRFAESGRGIRSGSLDSSRAPSRFRAGANGACSGEPGCHPTG